MATIDVKDAAGVTVPIEKPLAPGRAAAAASRPVALSTEDAAFLDGIEAALITLDGRVDGLEALLTTQAGFLDGIEGSLASILAKILTAPATEAKQDTANTALALLDDAGVGEYETVAASQTTQALGATGATGDYLSGVLIIPGTTSPGAVAIKDGANGAITIFTGGASSVSNLVPFMVPLGIRSAAGAWQVTTGANVTAIGVGNFT